MFMGKTRVYYPPRFRYGSCTPESGYYTLTSSPTADPCYQNYHFTAPISYLEQRCGFTVSDFTESNVRYAKYSGDVLIQYTENYTLGGIQELRNVTQALPVIHALQKGYTNTINDGSLDVAINVVSPWDLGVNVAEFQFMHPITNKSSLKISFDLSYPYSVISFNPSVEIITSAGLQAEDVYVLSYSGTGKHDGQITLCVNSTNTSTNDYLETINGTTNQIKCRRHLVVRLEHPTGTNPTADQLVGKYRLKDINVKCADGIPEVDCPLPAPGTLSYIEFDLTKDMFCKSVEFSDTSAAGPAADKLEVLRFLVPIGNSTTDYSVKHGLEERKTFGFGETIFLRADFLGIKLDGIAVTKIDADSQEACSWTGSKRIAETTKVNPSVDTELGLKDRTDPDAIAATGGSTQYFLMKRRIDTAIMPNPAEGTTSPMIIRVVVAIDYTLGRRRRRSFMRITEEGMDTYTPETVTDPAVFSRQRREAEGGLVMALSGTVNYTDPVTLSELIEINFNISVAVTGLTTTPNAIKSYVQLTTTVNWPFALIGWDPEIAVLNGSFANGSVTVVTGMGSDTTNNVAPACLNTSYFDPVTGNTLINNETTLCKQLVYLRYDHPNNGICEVAGLFLLKNITVRCGADVDPTDCPFLPGFNNSESYVSFYVQSPNFCQSLGLQATINGLVTIERFTAPRWLTDTDKKHSLVFQRAWSYDQPLFLRMDLTGTAVSAITIEKLEKSEGTGAFAGDYKSATTVTDGVGLLGLGTRTEQTTIDSTGARQYFLFAVNLPQVLANSPPNPGSLKSLSFRATVQVEYEASARRRRSLVQSEMEVDPANYSDRSEEAADSLNRQKRAVGSGQGVVAITGTLERPVTSLMSEQDWLDSLKDKSAGSLGANPCVLGYLVGVLVVKFGLEILL